MNITHELHPDCDAIVVLYLIGINTINEDVALARADTDKIWREWRTAGTELGDKIEALNPQIDALFIPITIPPVKRSNPNMYRANNPAISAMSYNITLAINARIAAINFPWMSNTSASKMSALDIGQPTAWTPDGLHHEDSDNKKIADAVYSRIWAWLDSLD